MSKFVEKIPAITGIVLVLVSVLLVLLVYVGGNADPILNAAGEEMVVPEFTDILLYWTYILIGVTVLITLGGSLIGNARNLIENPKTAVRSLIPIVAFVLIFVISWYLGSENRISIIGYEGTENEGVWARFTDMVLYSTYVLFVLVIITIIGARINDSLK